MKYLGLFFILIITGLFLYFGWHYNEMRLDLRMAQNNLHYCIENEQARLDNIAECFQGYETQRRILHYLQKELGSCYKKMEDSRL